MNLSQVTTQLEKLMAELELEVPKLEELEEKYYARFYELILNSPASNMQGREAYAKEVCRTEGLREPYQLQKLKVRILLTRKEMLFELSRNLRNLNV